MKWQLVSKNHAMFNDARINKLDKNLSYTQHKYLPRIQFSFLYNIKTQNLYEFQLYNDTHRLYRFLFNLMLYYIVI